ncbi:MAG: hypothetical protein O7B26_07715, partial [Planctomycetota bacterium]|nr:hypothetical protein [Planctomycetota bacterium]
MTLSNRELYNSSVPTATAGYRSSAPTSRFALVAWACLWWVPALAPADEPTPTQAAPSQAAATQTGSSQPVSSQPTSTQPTPTQPAPSFSLAREYVLDGNYGQALEFYEELAKVPS